MIISDFPRNPITQAKSQLKEAQKENSELRTHSALGTQVVYPRLHGNVDRGKTMRNPGILLGSRLGTFFWR